MKKSLIIITYVVCIIVIGVLGVLLYRAYNGENKLASSTTFTDGFYTNKVGTKISENDFHILALISGTKKDIASLTEAQVKAMVNDYYSQLESYEMYGYVGSYAVTDQKTGNANEIDIFKIAGKTLPFTSSELEFSEEYFCVLGTTAYGTFVLSKYQDGKCAFEQKICDVLLESGTDSDINLSIYCA